MAYNLVAVLQLAGDLGARLACVSALAWLQTPAFCIISTLGAAASSDW